MNTKRANVPFCFTTIIFFFQLSFQYKNNMISIYLLTISAAKSLNYTDELFSIKTNILLKKIFKYSLIEQKKQYNITKFCNLNIQD